jgi:hypothetical protein
MLEAGNRGCFMANHWVVSRWLLLAVLAAPSAALPHHKLDCTTGLLETFGASSSPSTTYRGRTGMGFSFNDSAFMKSGSAQIEVENPSPSSSQTFPGKRSTQVAAASASKPSAHTRAPASIPESKPERSERPHHERKLPDPPRLPEPPRIAREPENNPNDGEEGSITQRLL